MLKNSFLYGNEIIDYRVRVSSRRRTFSIEVHPDLSVVACAPMGYALNEIEYKLREAAAWILKKQASFKQRGITQAVPFYIAGASHFYLGQAYSLHAMESRISRVELLSDALCVYAASLAPAEIKRQLHKWYHERALTIFDQLLNECFPLFAERGHQKPNFRIRFMRSRWGSLSPKQSMSLNTHLIRTPIQCIRYVIIHELCHLEHRNHGVRFYRLLEKMMPDWRQAESILKTYVL